MKCPTCNVALTMSDRNGIEIDYCPQCRGIWLDRGELDKIIERSVQNEPNPQPQPNVYPNRDRYHSDKDYHKRKKGFLGELFDF